MVRQLAIILSIIAGLATGISGNSLPASKDFTEIRPVGEIRVWTFVARDSVLGRLQSSIHALESVDGVEALAITQQLQIDFGKLGYDQKVDMNGELLVSRSGHFLGSDLEMVIGDRTEMIRLRKEGESLTGYATRGGDKLDQTIVYDVPRFAVAGYFVDQLELFLSMRTLTVGDTINEVIVDPLDLTSGEVIGTVVSFSPQPLFNEVMIDCFLITLDRPQRMELFFTMEKHLAKVNFKNQKLSAFLDLVQAPPPPLAKAEEATATTTARTTNTPLATLIPIWAIYLLFGGLSILFYAMGGFQHLTSYAALGFGGIAYLVARITQYPLQGFVIRNYLLPGVGRGESIFVLGFLPALVAGIFQTLLVVGSVLLIMRLLGVRRQLGIATGAFVGAGFALLEASWLATSIPASVLMSWGIMERGFMILFHVTVGALIGYALPRGRDTIFFVLGTAVATNALIRYLPILVDRQVLPMEIIYIVMAVIVLLLTGGAVLTFKKAPLGGSSST